MWKLVEQAKEQFDIENVGIVHRLGKMEIGETSVIISVASPHRRAAFEACEWLIKELKRTVPIWKKEFTKAEKFGFRVNQVSFSLIYQNILPLENLFPESRLPLFQPNQCNFASFLPSILPADYSKYQ